MNQIAMEFGAAASYAPEDYLTSPANEAAHRLVAAWPDWPGPLLFLSGPKASGKTHLAHLWAARSEASWLAPERIKGADSGALLPANARLVIDDVEKLAEEAALFHLLNALKERGGHLLITASRPLTQLKLATPDLRSRLAAGLSASIEAPDDALLRAVMLKHCADRQIKLPPEVLDYLLVRMERSFAAAAELTERLDTASLQQKRRITLPFVEELLKEWARI